MHYNKLIIQGFETGFHVGFPQQNRQTCEIFRCLTKKQAQDYYFIVLDKLFKEKEKNIRNKTQATLATLLSSK